MARSSMAGLALALFGFLAAAPSVASPIEADNRAAEIKTVLDDSATAWSTGDLDGFMHSYEDSAATSYIKPPGVVSGYAAIHDMYAAHYGHGDKAKMGKLGLSIVSLRPLGGDYALVTGHYYLTRSKDAGGDASGIFTLVFHKSDAGWRIISDHTS